VRPSRRITCMTYSPSGYRPCRSVARYNAVPPEIGRGFPRRHAHWGHRATPRRASPFPDARTVQPRSGPPAIPSRRIGGPDEVLVEEGIAQGGHTGVPRVPPIQKREPVERIGKQSFASLSFRRSVDVVVHLASQIGRQAIQFFVWNAATGLSKSLPEGLRTSCAGGADGGACSACRSPFACLDARAPATPPALRRSGQGSACRSRVTARRACLFVVGQFKWWSLPYAHHTQETHTMQMLPRP